MIASFNCQHVIIVCASATIPLATSVVRAVGGVVGAVAFATWGYGAVQRDAVKRGVRPCPARRVMLLYALAKVPSLRPQLPSPSTVRPDLARRYCASTSGDDATPYARSVWAPERRAHTSLNRCGGSCRAGWKTGRLLRVTTRSFNDLASAT